MIVSEGELCGRPLVHCAFSTKVCAFASQFFAEFEFFLFLEQARPASLYFYTLTGPKSLSFSEAGQVIGRARGRAATLRIDFLAGFSAT